MERKYIIKELENVAERLRNEAYVIERISKELDSGTANDRMIAPVVMDKSGSLYGICSQIETISQLIKI